MSPSPRRTSASVRLNIFKGRVVAVGIDLVTNRLGRPIVGAIAYFISRHWVTAMADRLHLETGIESWPLKSPFRITGHTFVNSDVLVTSLSDGVHGGRGEAAGVYYHGDTPAKMLAAVETVRAKIEAGVTRERCEACCPPARPQRPGLRALGFGSREIRAPGLAGRRRRTAQAALDHLHRGGRQPEDHGPGRPPLCRGQGDQAETPGRTPGRRSVAAVRAARNDVWLAVDANQGFTPQTLEALTPALVEADVKLVEQPFPIGDETLLDGYKGPIEIAADESVQSLGDVGRPGGPFPGRQHQARQVRRAHRGLLMAREARRLGLKVMVGNMTGTSLAMDPPISSANCATSSIWTARFTQP